MNKLLVTCFCFAVIFGAKSQPLKIGDYFPLHQILASQPNKAYQSLDSSKGKFLILDFWSIYCASCIAAFPKLELLQNQMKDSIQIILINSESAEQTAAFFKSKKNIQVPKVPLITSDTVLHKTFETEAYPAHVWIDNNGRVSAITDGYSTTTDNIRLAIKGSFSDEIKRPVKATYGTILPDSLTHRYLFFSCLRKFDSSIDIGNADKLPLDNGRLVRLSAHGASVVDLLKKAYREDTEGYVNTDYGLVLEEQEENTIDKFNQADNSFTWLTSNLWDYELVMPANAADSCYKIMQHDIQNSFPLSTQVKNRTVAAIELKQMDKRKLKICKSDSSEGLTNFDGTHLDGFPDSIRILRNRPIEELVNWLRLWTENEFAFKNSLHFSGNINIDIREESINPLCLTKLQEDLQRQGITLSLTKVEKPVLIVKVKEGSNPPLLSSKTRVN